MCSVRLLIRVVRIAICTSGDPESDSSRRYSWINSRFRSLVTVIAGRVPLRCSHGPGPSPTQAYDESPYAATTSGTIPLKKLDTTTSRSMYQCRGGLQGQVGGLGLGARVREWRLGAWGCNLARRSSRNCQHFFEDHAVGRNCLAGV